MESDNTSDGSGDCNSYYQTPAYLGVVLVTSGISLISFISIIFMILLIFLFKKYQFFTQRLILYLAFASLANSFVGIINITGIWAFENAWLSDYCQAVGFLAQNIFWCVVLATTCITVDIFFKVVFKRATEKLEWLYIVITFLSPFVLTGWIPFVFDAWGQFGPFCWIRGQERNDCSEYDAGVILQVALLEGPVLVFSIILGVIVTISMCLLHRQSRRWSGMYDSQALEMKKRMETEIRPLIVFPFIVLGSNILLEAGFLYGAIYGASMPSFSVVNNPWNITLWYFESIVFRMQDILVVGAFVLDPGTWRRLNCTDIRAACANTCSKHQLINDFPIEEGSVGDSVQWSSLSHMMEDVND